MHPCLRSRCHALALATLVAAGVAHAAPVPPPPDEGTCPEVRLEPTGTDDHRDQPGVQLEEGMVIEIAQLLLLRQLLPAEIWQHREVFFHEGMRMEIGACHRRYPVPARVEIDRLPGQLHEPMGMTFVGRDLFVSQRHNVLRYRDADGDGVPEPAGAITEDWPWDNRHQFSPGLVHRRENGRDVLYGALTVSILKGGTSMPSPPNRGTVYRVAVPPLGETSPVEYIAGGLRTPDGVGAGPRKGPGYGKANRSNSGSAALPRGI